MFKIYMPHQNLGCLGFSVCGFYFDVTFPPREGWGWSWGGLVRVYWRWRGLRHWLLLPGLHHRKDRHP